MPTWKGEWRRRLKMRKKGNSFLFPDINITLYLTQICLKGYKDDPEDQKAIDDKWRPTSIEMAILASL